MGPLAPAAAPLRILLLCDEQPSNAATIQDHIAAIEHGMRHKVSRFNPRPGCHLVAVDFDAFDVVILHYSLCAILQEYLPERYRRALAAFGGLKIQFIQDDYRWVDRFGALMAEVGIDLLFTLVPEGRIDAVWGRYGIAPLGTFTTLAGYVPRNFADYDPPPLAARPLHVAYRGRELPYWLGKLSQEKVQIARGFAALAPRYGLRCDIGWREEDRIYGRSWEEFLCSARGVLGTESGASITDFDGRAEQAVRRYQAEHPGATFEEVHAAVLEPFEGNVVMNVISPRMFEAIALKTALVAFPGDYLGILRPWDHYLPLEKDFSNMEEVAKRLHDLGFLEELTARAYEEIVASGRYGFDAFARDLERRIDEAYARKLGTSRVALGAVGAFRSRASVALAQTIDPRRRYSPALAVALGLTRRVRGVLLVLLGRPGRFRRLRWLTMMMLSGTGRALLRIILARKDGISRLENLPAASRLGAIACARSVSLRVGSGARGGRIQVTVDGRSQAPGEDPAALEQLLRAGRVQGVAWRDERFSGNILGVLPAQIDAEMPADLARVASTEIAAALVSPGGAG